MAKGKNEKADRPAGKADQAKAAKAGGTGKKDAKKAPRPAVAAERATAGSGSTLPGPPPPATVPEAVVPAARTSPDDATGHVPAAAPVAPPVAPTSGSGTNGARRPAAAPAAPAAAPVPVAASERRPGLVDELTTLAMMPVDVARRVLPERRLPFYLGVGALAVVGVVEWPVVLAAGMAWEALRRRRS